MVNERLTGARPGRSWTVKPTLRGPVPTASPSVAFYLNYGTRERPLRCTAPSLFSSTIFLWI